MLKCSVSKFFYKIFLSLECEFGSFAEIHFIKMSKVTPLPSYRNLLQWMRVLSFEEDASITERIISIAIAMVLIISIVIVPPPSAVYIWKYISTDLEGCLYALFQIAGIIGSINAVITVLLCRYEIVSMFGSLSQIYDERKGF